MSSSRGRQQETNLQNQAQAATNAAAVVNPLQQQQQDRILNFNNQWDSGTDVKDINYLKPYYNLYEGAARDTDPEAGGGLLANNLLSGANGRLATLIGEQQASRRKEAASGQLYDAANQAQQAATSEGNVVAGADTAQRMGVANLANQRYTAYLDRPQRPSIWEQILGGAMNAGAAYAGRP
jgi:hypothetical protein